MRTPAVFLALVFIAVAAPAGTVQLLSDPDFATFPVPCTLGTDTDCWAAEAGTWISTGIAGNTQPGGSGPPAALCESDPEEGVIEGVAQCQLGQCVDISAFPVGTSFSYGIAHFQVVAPAEATVSAIAYGTSDCSGPGELRDQVVIGAGPLDVWDTSFSAFASQAGDMGIIVLVEYTPQTIDDLRGSAPRGNGNPLPFVAVDDGFLIADIDGPVITQEIPTASTFGLVALATLLLLATLARLRDHRASR